MSEIERRGTGRSAAGLAIIAVLVVALIALTAWVLTRPGFLDELANVLVVAAVAIAIVLVVAYIAYAVLAVAEYAYKGISFRKGSIIPSTTSEESRGGPWTTTVTISIARTIDPRGPPGLSAPRR